MTVYNDQVSQYITNLFAIEDEALRSTREDSLQRGLPPISINPEEGRFLQFLVRACGARLAVELGTLGGYSAIWIARGLPPGGKLISVDKDAGHAEIARAHLSAAGLRDLVQVWVGEANGCSRNLAWKVPSISSSSMPTNPGIPSTWIGRWRILAPAG
jgi:caffeoyl-CoA O-methyltransferase